MTNDARVFALQNAVGYISEDYFTDYGGGWPDEIATALIDAVFSIRARYRASDPAAGVIGRVRTFRAEEESVVDDLAELRDLGSDRIRELMGATVTARRQKAEVVIDAAEAFTQRGIVHATDFLAADRLEMKRVYTGVHGLGWVTFEYFTMLLGIPGVKADTMITRYVNLVLGEANLGRVSNQNARELVINAHDTLKRGETLTHFEHAIWKFQSDRDAESRRRDSAEADAIRMIL